MRAAMRAILEQAGFDIREAPDGETAIELIGESVPDVVFLDLHMPGIEGAEVLSWIKEDPERARARVIIVTATGEEGRQKVIDLGADEYFVKPFSPLALLETVERVMGSEAGGASGA